MQKRATTELSFAGAVQMEANVDRLANLDTDNPANNKELVRAKRSKAEKNVEAVLEREDVDDENFTGMARIKRQEPRRSTSQQVDALWQLSGLAEYGLASQQT